MSYRVILHDVSLQAFDIDTTLHQTKFSIGPDTFTVVDHAPEPFIQFSKEEIMRGKTAAVISHTMLRPSAVFMDMDATVIEEESLVEIGRAAGKLDEIQKLTEDAMSGSLDFKESLQRRLQILRGTHRSIVESIKPTIMSGMTHWSSWCHKHEIPMFLVSGGFLDIAGPVCRQLDFADFKANRLAWNDDHLSGWIEGAIVDANGKLNAIESWSKIHNLNLRNCLAVGDGANDIQMLSAVGLAAGMKPKPRLWPILDIANHTGDHRFMIHALQSL